MRHTPKGGTIIDYVKADESIQKCGVLKQLKGSIKKLGAKVMNKEVA